MAILDTWHSLRLSRETSRAQEEEETRTAFREVPNVPNRKRRLDRGGGSNFRRPVSDVSTVAETMRPGASQLSRSSKASICDFPPPPSPFPLPPGHPARIGLVEDGHSHPSFLSKIFERGPCRTRDDKSSHRCHGEKQRVRCASVRREETPAHSARCSDQACQERESRYSPSAPNFDARSLSVRRIVS